MRIKLSDHFTYKKLLLYALPSVGTMLFTSVYCIVDGFFVSNFVGKSPFAAVNFIFPFLMIMGAVGTMLGTGGSALVAKTLGEGRAEDANRLFSLIVYTLLTLGAVFSVLGILALRPVASLLGAEGEMLENCLIYGRIFLLGMPAFMLQYCFQSFFVTAEKPRLGLYFTVGAGCANMALDALFVAVLRLGLAGAALATVICQCIGGLLPLIYFGCKNESLLRLGKTRSDIRALLKASGNGSSEFISNISMSVVGMLYNVQLLKYAGENGVAAYGVLMYVMTVFIAVFIGYAIGTAPIVGFHYGAGNTDEMKNLFKKSLVIIGCCAVCMFAAGELLADPLSRLFVGYDGALCELTKRGFFIYSFSFILIGFPIYGSAFFTALNNGAVSALISFLRTLVFETASILLLPLLLGTDGIWLSIVVAETVATLLTVFFWCVKAKKYNYA